MQHIEKRNNAIDIAKGFGIILMVIGHAEMPGILTRSIYLFHMPLFFIAAGYFFKTSALDNPCDFIKKRFKGLYIPFVKYSLFFLLIHNLLFKVGILNEVYGNWENGVTHPYTWHQFWQRMVYIVTSMEGYDEFLAGAFWFFRALLVASIMFLVLYKLLNKFRILHNRTTLIPVIICLLAILMGSAMCIEKIRISMPQGGFRDTMGLFFFGLGVLYRKYESKIGHNLIWAIIGAAIVIGASYLKWCGMNVKPSTFDAFTLPLTGLAGWIMVYNISYHIDQLKPNKISQFLAYCGNKSLYILVWHISAYKLVSLLKIYYYGLDIRQIGCHMVVHHNSANDLFWVLYSIVGVVVPISLYYLYSKYLAPRIPKINCLVK
ncbi:MAG: acyltransferase family protein [Muribaculaceae bacterium]|nr:acyltransferase family protein [Muribaculaceae bacterium]MBQ7855373.1 acyltransferase family protein [Muribaculaceae bacterium]